MRTTVRELIIEVTQLQREIREQIEETAEILRWQRKRELERPRAFRVDYTDPK